MASYDLRCLACGHEFEVFVQGFLKDECKVCPECGSVEVEQRFTGFLRGGVGFFLGGAVAGWRVLVPRLRLSALSAGTVYRRRDRRAMLARWGMLFLVVALAGVVGLLDSEAAIAADTTTTTLTSSQEALAQRVEGELIAPCCWVQPVAVHDSQAARDIKREVRELVAQGKTEQQILDTFIARYGEKILAAPPARASICWRTWSRSSSLWWRVWR